MIGFRYWLMSMIGMIGVAQGDGELELLMREDPDVWAVASDPKWEVQVRWVREDGETHEFNVDDSAYFYPASTIKLPAALMALERVEQLRGAGVTRDSVMITGREFSWQTPVSNDPSAKSGKPSVGHYAKKIFLVSDNDAHNRLYELVGQERLNEGLRNRGYRGVRILHRLSVGEERWQGQLTNPVSFYSESGELLAALAPQRSLRDYSAGEAIERGEKHWWKGALYERPMDFREKNALPLRAQQEMLRALIAPREGAAWRISEEDREFLVDLMGRYPSEVEWPKYDAEEYPDGYAKFLLCGGREASPEGVTVRNKSGLAYGFVIDNAYIEDAKSGAAFFLAAVISVNMNGVYNDNDYAYKEVAFPFMKQLGALVLAYEREQKRSRPTPNQNG